MSDGYKISGANNKSSTANLITNIDVAGANTYIGEAVPGSSDAAAVWRIRRIVDTGPDSVIRWADGNTNFDNIWNNRAALIYS